MQFVIITFVDMQLNTFIDAFHLIYARPLRVCEKVVEIWKVAVGIHSINSQTHKFAKGLGSFVALFVFIRLLHIFQLCIFFFCLYDFSFL
jgi:hypothetical protein